ncbi:MAG: hypothetical protein JSW23_03210 [Planctomycetota bacterium]|nr:MAG: hypothetical protein JSW23_03210 [Planctomycetota bacterium]
MAEAKKARAGHDKHLCYVGKLRAYKTVVEQCRFFFKAGGRSLCKQVKL